MMGRMPQKMAWMMARAQVSKVLISPLGFFFWDDYNLYILEF